MDILESGFEDAVAVLELPERYSKRIFPNRESAIRLIGALLMETR
ncbi:transposase [Carboxydothermus pertinax]|nr:transposase [Carboxydothermus pertinax]